MTDQLLRVDAEAQHADALRWNLVAAALLSSVVLGYGITHSSIASAFTDPVFHVRAQDESTALLASTTSTPSWVPNLPLALSVHQYLGLEQAALVALGITMIITVFFLPRFIQAAIPQLLEPIFEAEFYSVSYGFRPKRSVRDPVEHLRLAIKPPKERNQPLWRYQTGARLGTSGTR